MGRPSLVWTAPANSPNGDSPGFTSHDRIALTCWMQRADAHGYRRMLIEDGAVDGPAEAGAYVLLYVPGRDWARWGVARSKGRFTVWDCGTGADQGEHPTMFAALCSLPPACPNMTTRAAAPGTRTSRPRLILVEST